jgi:glycine/D-amino acid oxidase-like deaminating enzyme
VESFVQEGGEYRQYSVLPGPLTDDRMQLIRLSDGANLAADHYIFACGPWLGKMFPEVLGNLIQPTRQEVFFFGTPPGDSRYDDRHFPVWIQHGERLIYGVPGNQNRGFKVADDTHGPGFDPTSGDRVISQENLRAARELLEMRFPGMKGAPLVESRVCQYENSPDGHFIIDRHPQARNVWLVGGGSGHGYKHGPALGEYVSGVILEKKQLDPFFQLTRFQK